jgi:hypothetical protein
MPAPTNGEAEAPREPGLQGCERVDLAVYAYRVLAVLRALDPIQCDAVLRAALELNRAARIEARLPPPDSESE